MNDDISTKEVKETWSELRLLVESMERDLDKNLIKANSTAGRRVRASLRDVKKKANDLIKQLVELDKSRKV